MRALGHEEEALVEDFKRPCLERARLAVRGISKVVRVSLHG